MHLYLMDSINKLHDLFLYQSGIKEYVTIRIITKVVINP